MKKKIGIVFGIILMLILAIVIFPVYRLVSLAGIADYYSRSELLKAVYIGTPWDIAQAQGVMELADRAFSDCGHSRAENEANYGELARYASSVEAYPETVGVKHSLRLWSAHLEEDEGYLWVYYSQQGFDKDGEVDYASRGVPSLWRVEKDENGTWIVADIKEHP